MRHLAVISLMHKYIVNRKYLICKPTLDSIVSVSVLRNFFSLVLTSDINQIGKGHGKKSPLPKNFFIACLYIALGTVLMVEITQAAVSTRFLQTNQFKLTTLSYLKNKTNFGNF